LTIRAKTEIRVQMYMLNDNHIHVASRSAVEDVEYRDDDYLSSYFHSHHRGNRPQFGFHQ